MLSSSDDEQVCHAAAANEAEPDGAVALTAVDKYKAAHRTACKSWDMPANFPEQKVLDAYATPRVDTNKSSFTFHKPDVDILRGYCARQFNWSQVLRCDCLCAQVCQHNCVHLVTCACMLCVSCICEHLMHKRCCIHHSVHADHAQRFARSVEFAGFFCSCV
jgi:hypothetical protein